MCATQTARPAPAGPGNEPPKTSCLSADGCENKPGEHAGQEAIAALQREFAAEALLVAAIKAARAAAGFYPDGRIAEILLSTHKISSAIEAIARDAAT
jgi:hypothetical protein